MISFIILYFIFNSICHGLGERKIMKFLQINDDSYSKNLTIKNYMGNSFPKLINKSQPDIILYMSKMKFSENNRIYLLRTYTNAMILPVIGYESSFNCSCKFTIIIGNCYYKYKSKIPGVTFIILNSNMWSNKQSTWLEDQLSNLYKNQENAIIVGFKSPKIQRFYNKNKSSSYDNNNRIIDLFIEFSQIIKGYIFNGDNFDSIRILLNKNQRPSSLMFTPTPVSIFDEKIPTARAFSFDSDLYEITNYIDYTWSTTSWTRRTILSKLSHKISVKASRSSITTNKIINEMNIQNWKNLAENVMNSRSTNKITEQREVEWYCIQNRTKWLSNCDKCSNNSDFNNQKSNSQCVVIVFTKSDLEICLRNCETKYIYGLSQITPIKKNNEPVNNGGALFVLAVIVGFILVLLGIVLAVNKVYCVHKSRQRSIFLAPLTLEVHADNSSNTNTTIKNNNGSKCSNNSDDNISESNNDNINNKIDKIQITNHELNKISKKSVSNGYKRTNSDCEKSYNYVRM